ncbi:MAG: phosphatidate cytidylyltransferase [Spirochaetaceae bacterium]|nr:MAG: phosphatidate cytidylyltransferase [Spirochaetaceae bacterium]
MTAEASTRRRPMKNVITRVLVFAVGIPALIGLILLLPNFYHLPFNVLVIFATGIASVELAGILAARPGAYRIPRSIAFGLGAVLPVTALLTLFVGATPYSLLTVVVTITALILGFQGFRRDERHFSGIIPLLTTVLFLMVYPGLFGSYLVRLSGLAHSKILIVVFVASVYLNDSLAYAVGMLFGKRNERLVPVSPNKSLAGFVAGFVTSIVVMVAAAVVMPAVFPGSLIRAAVLGAAVGCAAIVGDLAESALKRSAVVKDSGDIIPGRGGLLDSVDSPLFSAFVFYYLYLVLFIG